MIYKAFIKFANFCVQSIENYLRISKWCVSFFAGYIIRFYALTICSKSISCINRLSILLIPNK